MGRMAEMAQMTGLATQRGDEVEQKGVGEGKALQFCLHSWN